MAQLVVVGASVVCGEQLFCVERADQIGQLQLLRTRG